jgi:hypothetical protein
MDHLNEEEELLLKELRQARHARDYIELDFSGEAA